MAVVVSKVEASFHVECHGTNHVAEGTIDIDNYSVTKLHQVHPDPDLTRKVWIYGLPGAAGTVIGTDTTEDGECSIILDENGSDIDYTITTPIGVVSGTTIGGNGPTLDAVTLRLSNNRPLPIDASDVTCAWIKVTHGVTTEYQWDSSDELVDWGDPSNAGVTGGVLIVVPFPSVCTLDQVFTYEAPSGRALTSVLSAPGIQRIAAVSSGNVLQDRYASGALADILTGSLADNHPELVHVGAGGHHLGLVWQRTNDICITTGTGVPGIAGWPNTVQTVAIARSKPTACVIDPTHDLGVAYLNGTEALFSPAAWANGSYVMGTETLIASDAADERGQLLQSPDGYLLYVYRDSGGAVAIKRSANRGQTWS